uniref:Uncharacterized protein n=1 Tax=Anguilla anguilla TaxID=7936 RepID=A0A0E9PM54_ANGAN
MLHNLRIELVSCYQWKCVSLIKICMCREKTLLYTL